jgi:deazaflavin-dependent oxidoreductase (nitroreductase family)
MSAPEKIHNSPRRWVVEHIQRYAETDGRSGHIWQGVPTLLLTTRGRKSGKLRRTALIYGQDGDHYVVVASNGGRPKHPNWHLNLVENPAVEVQVLGDKFTALARIASGEERARLWRVMATIWPAYDDYQVKTKREIPVVVLECEG